MKTKSIPTVTASPVTPARLETLARSIKATADDIRSMTLAAGVEALEEALARSGKLELPLRFHVAPPGTRAVFITEEEPAPGRKAVTLEDTSGEWEKAARTAGKSSSEWLAQLADEEAFRTNYAKQIESMKDRKAFEKAKSGSPISFDEFERSQRHRKLVAAEGGQEA